MAVAADGVDINVNDSFDQAYLQNVLANLKIQMDNFMSHIDTRERENDRLIGVRGTRSEDFQSKVNDMHLRWVDNNMRLVNNLAEGSGVTQQRIAANGAALDNMVLVGGMTRPDEVAEAVIGKSQVDAAVDVSPQALRDAVANVAQTSAAAQGTTGVAQGALQSQTPILQVSELAGMIEVNKALGVELAEIVKALAVVVVKVAEEDV